MTPLPRIRRRRTEEQPADQSPAVAEPVDAPTAVHEQAQATAQLAGASVAPPGAASQIDHRTVAQAAATVQATAEIQAPDATPPPDETPSADGEPSRPSGLRRFGRWASGQPVAPEGSEPAVDPEPEPVVVEPEPMARPREPSSKDRGRLRRRIRYLRRARELGFRDLGGLMFDQYRFRSPNQELLGAKLAALHALDSERRALEHILGERREFDDLREPGISACPQCGALHSSNARFCEVCGTEQIEVIRGNGADGTTPTPDATPDP